MIRCLPLASHRAADLRHRCFEPIYSGHYQEADVWALLHAHFVEQSLHVLLCNVDLQGFHRHVIREKYVWHMRSSSERLPFSTPGVRPFALLTSERPSSSTFTFVGFSRAEEVLCVWRHPPVRQFQIARLRFV